jgi:bifunctional pyridoxal-dependent enzyme with beta-cystathionase and maltose regulon repressor activities
LCFLPFTVPDKTESNREESTAGMFLWIDLRRYMTGSKGTPSLWVHSLTPQEREEYQRRELEISNRCFANGVGIGQGTNFFTEVLGWFRLTFSVPREPLEIGLQRMMKVLKEIEQLW